MRKGVVLFLAGIGLLCVGIVSTSNAFWGKQVRGGKIPIEIGDATTVDLRGINFAKVLFSDAEPPGLRYERMGSGSADMARQLVVGRTGPTLRLASKREAFYGTTLVLPLRINKIVAENARFEGNSHLSALRIEASGDVDWKGDVRTLTLVSVAKPQRKQGQACVEHVGCGESTFSIGSGSIGSLAIDSKRGNIHLGDVQRVGTITLGVGPETGLQLDHIADLARIRIEKLDERSSAPQGP